MEKYNEDSVEIEDGFNNLDQEIDNIDNEIDNINHEISILENIKTDLITKPSEFLPQDQEDYDYFNSVSYEVELIDEQIFYLNEQKENLEITKEDVVLEFYEDEANNYDVINKVGNIETKSIDYQKIDIFCKLVFRKRFLTKKIESMKQEIVNFIKAKNKPIKHNGYTIKTGEYKKFQYSKCIEITESSLKKAKEIERLSGKAHIQKITTYPIVSKDK